MNTTPSAARAAAFTFAMLVGALHVDAATEAQPIQKKSEREQAWKIGSQALDPASVASAPGDGAGCLVVGYHVLKDGAVAKPRVMQGAFTRATSPGVQQAFIAAALASAKSWKYQPVRRGVPTDEGFEMAVIGYVPARADGADRLVIGEPLQDARVRQACHVESLADWGRRNAVAVEAAPDHGGKVLTPKDQPVAAYWVSEELTPPRYPPAAFQRAVEGCVVLGLTIGKDGVPTEFRVMRSYTSPSGIEQVKKLLENAALAGASQWRFEPGPDNLQRMPALLQFPVSFMLDDPPRNSACQEIDLSAPT